MYTNFETPQGYFLRKKNRVFKNIRVHLAPLPPSQVYGSVFEYYRRSIGHIFSVLQIPTQNCLTALLLFITKRQFIIKIIYIHIKENIKQIQENNFLKFNNCILNVMLT